MTRSDIPPIVSALTDLLGGQPAGTGDLVAASAPATEATAPSGKLVVEIGIGRRDDAARALADAGHHVIAIDITDRSVPDGVAFREVDVHDLADGTASTPDSDLPVAAASDDGESPAGTSIDAVYARNLPAELHPPAARFASRVAAPLLFTTLGFETPSPALPSTLDRRSVGSETVFIFATD